MDQPFFPIDLSPASRDFRPVALELGMPMIDKGGANARAVKRWLGRFAAQPEYDGEAVLYYLTDEQGTDLSPIDCRPCRGRRLRPELKAEIRDAAAQLAQRQPGSPKEAALFRTVRDTLARLAADPDGREARNCLFEYRDATGKWRLVWCWGYQEAGPLVGWLTVCLKAD